MTSQSLSNWCILGSLKTFYTLQRLFSYNRTTLTKVYCLPCKSQHTVFNKSKPRNGFSLEHALRERVSLPLSVSRLSLIRCGSSGQFLQYLITWQRVSLLTLSLPHCQWKTESVAAGPTTCTRNCVRKCSALLQRPRGSVLRATFFFSTLHQLLQSDIDG